ncbi:MAG: hypothetical protein M3N18_09950 [Actinomycetota bacterium]|nr:hypothetical protein [Actinomycetota bacterium]
MTEREFPEIGPDDAGALSLASLLGVPELALELERVAACRRATTAWRTPGG